MAGHAGEQKLPGILTGFPDTGMPLVNGR